MGSMRLVVHGRLSDEERARVAADARVRVHRTSDQEGGGSIWTTFVVAEADDRRSAIDAVTGVLGREVDVIAAGPFTDPPPVDPDDDLPLS
jgi:hypothetical protein